MISTDRTVASQGPVPDLGRVLDCLARLDGKARVIVDRRGTVKAGSANTLGAADRGDLPLRFDGGGSAAMGTVARLLAVRGEETELAVMEVAPGGQTVVVRAAAIDAEHVCLVLATHGQHGSLRVAELQKLFGLTASEAGIVKDLMEGCAPQAIAARRRNSIHTIRAHIRQCHQKIGVKTREELFSRVAILCL
jgi:DNA-binding CsgD family transcriptional regulator